MIFFNVKFADVTPLPSRWGFPDLSSAARSPCWDTPCAAGCQQHPQPLPTSCQQHPPSHDNRRCLQVIPASPEAKITLG